MLTPPDSDSETEEAKSLSAHETFIEAALPANL